MKHLFQTKILVQNTQTFIKVKMESKKITKKLLFISSTIRCPCKFMHIHGIKRWYRRKAYVSLSLMTTLFHVNAIKSSYVYT